MDNTKDKLSAAGSSMRLLKKLKAKEDETSLFMSSFDPTVSRTAKLKKEKDNRKKKKGTDSKQDDLYDIKGILLRNGVNLCDCLDQKVFSKYHVNLLILILPSVLVAISTVSSVDPGNVGMSAGRKELGSTTLFNTIPVLQL